MQSSEPKPPSTSEQLPELLQPLRDERTHIEQLLHRLATSEDLAERAELGSELVRSTSRYEDTLERAVWPKALDPDSSTLQDLADERKILREMMTIIQKATQHIDARNVHASDPEGFEETLEDVSRRIRLTLDREDLQIRDIDASMQSLEERDQFTNAITRALHHASERPNPPRTSLGRAVSNANVKLDHNFPDVSSPQHSSDK